MTIRLRVKGHFRSGPPARAVQITKISSANNQKSFWLSNVFLVENLFGKIWNSVGRRPNHPLLVMDTLTPPYSLKQSTEKLSRCLGSRHPFPLFITNHSLHMSESRIQPTWHLYEQERWGKLTVNETIDDLTLDSCLNSLEWWNQLNLSQNIIFQSMNFTI